jgi:hypothetical protein
MIHYGNFDGVRLKASSFSAEVKSYPVGTPLEFTVRKARKPKTTPQNRYLHQLYSMAAREMNSSGFGDGTPWDTEKVKAYAKHVGLYPMEEMHCNGVVINVPMGTRDLDKEDAMLVIDRVLRHFADEHGIYLPEPGEQLTLAA